MAVVVARPQTGISTKIEIREQLHSHGTYPKLCTMKRIFLLDDDELVLESFAMILGDLGFEIVTESNAQKAIEIATTQEFDLILSDIRMPDLNGADAVRAIIAKRPRACIYVITAYPGDPMVKVAIDAGARGVMRKPFEIAKILDLLKD